MAFRIDRSGGSLRPARRLPNGGVRVDASLTRTGVFTYHNPDGSLRREYRPDTEVNDPESLASFEAVPVTDDHPPVMVTSRNARQYACGVSLPGIRMDADHMIGELTIWDDALIAKMDAGKVQVSNGYTCDLEVSPGVSPDGQPYDVVQRNIRGNHVAIVAHGRAGSARVRMDAVDFAIEVDAADVPATCTVADPVHTDGEHGADAILMPTIEELTTLRDAEKARADKAAADAAVEKARADAAELLAAKLEGERDAEKARADAAEQARTDASGAHEQALADAREQGRKDAVERLRVQSQAQAVLGDAYKADADTATLKLAVIAKVDNVDCAGRPEAYIDARFDSATERALSGAVAVANLRTAIVVTNPETAQRIDSEREATMKMQAAYGDAWKVS